MDRGGGTGQRGWWSWREDRPGRRPEDGQAGAGHRACYKRHLWTLATRDLPGTADSAPEGTADQELTVRRKAATRAGQHSMLSAYHPDTTFYIYTTGGTVVLTLQY